MPNKLFIFIFIISVQIFQASANQNIEANLAYADSLFEEQKYTQALETYNRLLHIDNYFNRPMLLKMAFINENVEDHTQALYCLNLLYLKYPHKAILAKMEELAESEELLGYQYTDSEYFVSLYKKYYFYLMSGLLAIALLTIVYLLMKYRRNAKLGQWPVLVFTTLFLAFFFNNYDVVPTKAIIKNSHSVLMSAPSAASEAIEIIQKGHRVVVDNQNDVWCKIDWRGKGVYIRKNNLIFVNSAN